MLRYQPTPELLKHRTILVTGAGSGIGRAVALGCAGAGATVILLGRTVSRLEQVYDEIEQIGAPTPAITPLNLATAGTAQYDELGAALESTFGELHGLVHCASDLGELGPLATYDFEAWQRVMQVDVQAPYILTRLLLPLLDKTADGSVIFTTADVGRRGRAYWGAYGVAQFALEGMVQIWADELQGAGRVRFNTLDPGPVRTAMRAAAYPAELPDTLARPEDVVTPYLYLLGADSRGRTGRAWGPADWKGD
ncbi:MAG TPA: YciK family oxidoreductase [Acidiferrobacteraceae bacterium]|nr:YciK family oxidoreductase [Acidiferrobacteraceae bacterium]